MTAEQKDLARQLGRSIKTELEKFGTYCRSHQKRYPNLTTTFTVWLSHPERFR